MATMTHQATRFAESRHHAATTSALVTLFWMLAAAAVAVIHTRIDPLSVPGGAAASAGAIVLCAYGYSRLCARCADVSHALGVGIAWLVFGIAAEMAVTARLGHGWYLVLGTPAEPLLRNVFLFVWIFAPVLFARQGENP